MVGRDGVEGVADLDVAPELAAGRDTTAGPAAQAGGRLGEEADRDRALGEPKKLHHAREGVGGFRAGRVLGERRDWRRRRVRATGAAGAAHRSNTGW